jgi:hypothetical protein
MQVSNYVMSNPKSVIAGLVPATHDNRFAVARLAAPLAAPREGEEPMRRMESGAASGAVDAWMFMGRRDEPGDDDVACDRTRPASAAHRSRANSLTLSFGIA